MSRYMIKSSWGSDDPTKAGFAFIRANALAEAGHDVQIFLQGEAVGLLRDSLAKEVVPVGFPPISDIMAKTAELGVRMHL